MMMAQLLVRNIDENVMDALRRKAKAEGLSLEEMARRALRDIARPSREELLAEIDRIRAMSKADPTFDSTRELRKLRDGDDDDR
jgi:plasmid stability protein